MVLLCLYPFFFTQNVANVPSTSCDLCTSKFEIATSNVLGGDIHYSTFDLEVNVTWNVTQYPLHHVTYALEKFKVNTSNGLRGQKNTVFDLEVKVTRNVAQNPVHHVTYTPTKI